jgi:hypothetical protein
VLSYFIIRSKSEILYARFIVHHNFEVERQFAGRAYEHCLLFDYSRSDQNENIQ